jgi:hypothetical protein
MARDTSKSERLNGILKGRASGFQRCASLIVMSIAQQIPTLGV